MLFVDSCSVDDDSSDFLDESVAAFLCKSNKEFPKEKEIPVFLSQKSKYKSLTSRLLKAISKVLAA